MKCKSLKTDSKLDYNDLHPMKWDTYVDGEPVDVYSVGDYYHTIGGRYGVSNLYACPRGKLPTSKNLVPFNGEAVDWGMNIQYNTHTYKNYIESNIRICITRNSEPFYSFAVNDLNFGLAKAQMILTFATEGPIWFSCQNFLLNEILGRKIRYKGKNIQQSMVKLI